MADVIERAMELWSNPGDLVFSPFAGIGSEGYVYRNGPHVCRGQNSSAVTSIWRAGICLKCANTGNSLFHEFEAGNDRAYTTVRTERLTSRARVKVRALVVVDGELVADCRSGARDSVYLSLAYAAN